MFLFRQLRVLAVVGFVSDEHRVHYRQHLPSYGDDSFLGPMLPFDAFIEFSHSRIVLSGGLGTSAGKVRSVLVGFSSNSFRRIDALEEPILPS